MAIINLQCNSNSLSQLLSSAENSVTGRAYMGEVLIQVFQTRVHDGHSMADT